MKAYRFCTGIFRLILTLMLGGGEWSTSGPSHFIPGKEPQYPFGGPRASLDNFKKEKKPLATARIQTLHCPANGPVTMPTVILDPTFSCCFCCCCCYYYYYLFTYLFIWCPTIRNSPATIRTEMKYHTLYCPTTAHNVVQLLKHFKIKEAAPTRFGLQRNQTASVV